MKYNINWKCVPVRESCFIALLDLNKVSNIVASMVYLEELVCDYDSARSK